MSALTLTPKRWYSWDFFVLDGARTLANFRLSSWREKGVLEVDGLDYDVYRESPFGDFILQHAGSILARATKPSAFRRSFVILDGETEVGSIVPENSFTRRAMVTLPDGWPLPVQSFAMWLTVIHWKRDAS
jgi:hypothetical protein